MCLILFAYEIYPQYPLVLLANRDEFHERPTAPAAFWEDAPRVLGGRDLRAGGTWMGVTRDGRWAALTNYRDPAAEQSAGPSRGHLVGDYLRRPVSAAEYMEGVTEQRHRYSGFNLLVGDAEQIFYLSNRDEAGPRRLRPGVYGLSNHLLDSAWPKVRHGKRELQARIAGDSAADIDGLFGILATTDPAPDPELPDTGVGRELERVLSPLFIVSPAYGTRASTVMLIDRSGGVEFIERSFLPGPTHGGEVRHHFTIEEPANR
jgi:uncharacterized protein with NRDE domain